MEKIKDFNPRSHERSDAIAVLMDDETRISIHAPTRGATKTVDVSPLLMAISIHAPTRGATISAAIQPHQ